LSYPTLPDNPPLVWCSSLSQRVKSVQQTETQPVSIKEKAYNDFPGGEYLMKSYHINNGAGLTSLTIREHDIPVPGPHEVLVRIRANSFNYRELLILQGTYPLPVKPDVIPLCDGAGEVVSIGSSVTRAKVGDRVMANSFPLWIDGPLASWEAATQIGGSLDGLLTEYAVLSEEAIVHIPEHLSFEEAATLPCAAVTAWQALTTGRSLREGESVLTLGSGGVSLFALQFAKLFGARVIATTSSHKKAERLRDLGADEVINYRETPDWHVAVRELTGGRGVDHVIETGGGNTLEQSIKSVALAGQITLIGMVASNPAAPLQGGAIDFGTFIVGLLTVRSILCGNRTQFIAMNEAIAANRIRPVIDRMFPFEEAKAAYQYYEEAQPFGKVIISQG
jgi:NADPH:quinone reductase-like Zn-dependent oxidoreductase